MRNLTSLSIHDLISSILCLQSVLAHRSWGKLYAGSTAEEIPTQSLDELSCIRVTEPQSDSLSASRSPHIDTGILLGNFDGDPPPCRQAKLTGLVGRENESSAIATPNLNSLFDELGDQ
jgi:hypothetical protein